MDARTDIATCTKLATFRVELLTDDVQSDVCDAHLPDAVRAADVYDQAPIVSVIANHDLRETCASESPVACGWELTD